MLSMIPLSIGELCIITFYTLLSMEKESVCSAHMATSPPSTSSFTAGVTVTPLSSSSL